MSRKAAFVFCFFVCFSPMALADEDIPVNLKADKLKFFEGTAIVEATGSVEVKLKEVTILADHVIMDSDTNVATADGHVRLMDAKYQATSTDLTYDIDSEQAQFKDFYSRLNLSKLRGPLMVTARQLDDQGNKMLGEKGSLSTCDKNIQHYFVLADKVEYYPDDRIIGYNATLYVGELPLLWLPVLYYDLHQQGRHNWSLGHNNTEGNYFKSTWGYQLGTLYLDLMENKGVGYGTQSNYNLWGLAAGSLFLYHLDEKDTGLSDWVTRINQPLQVTPWTKLTFDQKYTATYLVPSGRKDQTELSLKLQYQDQARINANLNSFDDRQAAYKKYNFGLSQAKGDVSTNYSFNYEFLTKVPNWIRASQQFSHRRTLWGGTYFNTKIDYYNSVPVGGQSGDERVDPVVELGGRIPGFNWRLNQNWYIDLDQNTYNGDDNYQYLEKQPELELNPDALDLKIFRLQPRLKYGYYHEVRYVPELSGNRSFASQRYQGVVNLDRNFTLGLGTVLGLGFGLDQIFYGPGDALYNFREKMSLQTNLGSVFRNELNYQRATSDGNSPFLFDQLGSRYHNVTDKITFYYLDRFRWTIDGGHNWQSHQWFDVMSAMMLKPASWLTWDARSGWSIEQRQYRDLVNNFTVAPYNFLTARLASVSDLNNGQLKVASLNYDLVLLAGEPNQCRLSFNQILDTNTQQFKVRDIMITKELHCWQLIYTYSDYRKEFSFTMSLKALPDEPLGVSSGQGFHFDALENQLKQLKVPEGAVQRY